MATWWKPWNRMGRAVNLIYRWRRPRAISFRLAFFLLISTTIHLTAFYVFEVVYPPNKKLLPRDAAVWVLPENDPRIQALMARHGAVLPRSPAAWRRGGVPATLDATRTRRAHRS